MSEDFRLWTLDELRAARDILQEQIASEDYQPKAARLRFEDLGIAHIFKSHDIGIEPELWVDPEKFYQLSMTCSCVSGYGECVDGSCMCILHLRNRPQTRAELDAFWASRPLAPRWRHLAEQVKHGPRTPVVYANLADIIGEDAAREAREAASGVELKKGADDDVPLCDGFGCLLDHNDPYVIAFHLRGR